MRSYDAGRQQKADGNPVAKDGRMILHIIFIVSMVHIRRLSGRSPTESCLPETTFSRLLHIPRKCFRPHDRLFPRISEAVQDFDLYFAVC